jgi:hypothetical protein
MATPLFESLKDGIEEVNGSFRGDEVNVDVCQQGIVFTSIFTFPVLYNSIQTQTHICNQFTASLANSQNCVLPENKRPF